MARPKGAKNGVTQDLVNQVRHAFQTLGGEEWLIEKANENPELMFRLLTKLIPQQTNISGELDSNVTITKIDYSTYKANKKE